MPSKLLLADDSVTIQRVIELTFADEDVEVTSVGDGQQAIDRVQTDPPDIVLADVGMPVRDGYDVAAFVRSQPALAHVPVILLTGAFEPVDETRARAAGCDGVLIKPFEPQMVINRVKDLLAGRRPAGLWSTPPTPQGPVRTADGPAALAVAPAPPLPPAPPESLEAYFERLDRAFTGFAESAPSTPLRPAPAPAGGQDTASIDPPPHDAADLDHWPADSTRPVVVPPRAETLAFGRAPSVVPLPAAAPAAGEPLAGSEAPPTSLVDAFAALLSAEQQTPIAAPAPDAAAPAIDDRAIDAIAQRILARVTEDAVRPAVLEVAERLVRQEIERLKAGS